MTAQQKLCYADLCKEEFKPYGNSLVQVSATYGSGAACGTLAPLKWLSLDLTKLGM